MSLKEQLNYRKKIICAGKISLDNSEAKNRVLWHTTVVTSKTTKANLIEISG